MFPKGIPGKQALGFKGDGKGRKSLSVSVKESAGFAEPWRQTAFVDPIRLDGRLDGRQMAGRILFRYHAPVLGTSGQDLAILRTGHSWRLFRERGVKFL